MIVRPGQQEPCFRLLATENRSGNNNSSPGNTAASILNIAQDNEPLFLSNNLSSQRLGEVIGKEIGCLITILQTDNYDAKSLAQMTRRMRHHAIIKLVGTRPGPNELKILDIPVVWLKVKPLVS